MTVGDRIKEKRKAFGWSQLEFAKRAGISQQLVTRLETGKVYETKKAGPIAKALGMSVDALLEEENPSASKVFGKLIREKRQAQGMTQLQLADRIGVTKGAVSHWELGRVEGIHPVHLHWLSKELHLTDEELPIFLSSRVLPFPELPPFPQSEMEVIHMYAALPENVRKHVRGIIEALSNKRESSSEQENANT